MRIKKKNECGTPAAHPRPAPLAGQAHNGAGMRIKVIALRAPMRMGHMRINALRSLAQEVNKISKTFLRPTVSADRAVNDSQFVN